MLDTIRGIDTLIWALVFVGVVALGPCGIGLQLSEQIRTYDLDQVSFIILLILAAVAAIDWISGKLRFAIIGRAQPPT